MAAETSPAFSFYVRDWLADAKVRAMTNEARGVYIDLLCYCWQDGALPSDPARLARVAGLSPKTFRRLWPQLEPCFTMSGDGWRQKRVEHERQRQLINRRVAAENGRKGADARWRGHLFANGEPIAKNSIASSSSFASTDLEQRAGARDPDPPNRRVLTRLAHDLPDDQTEADRKDDLKREAIRYGLAFDGDSVTYALDAVDRTRR